MDINKTLITFNQSEFLYTFIKITFLFDNKQNDF